MHHLPCAGLGSSMIAATLPLCMVAGTAAGMGLHHLSLLQRLQQRQEAVSLLSYLSRVQHTAAQLTALTQAIR